MPGPRAHRLLIPLAAAWCVAVSGVPSADPPARLSDCDEVVRRSPADYGSYDCYRTLAREHRAWAGAIGRLEDLLARDARNTLARVVLARIENDRGSPRAEELFRTSADEFAAAAMPVGEVFARLDLASLLRRHGRLDDSAAEVERARAAAAASGVPLLLTNVRTEEAWIAQLRADYVRAYELFREAEQEVFPIGPPHMQDSVLSGLGATLFAMGRDRESFAYYRRLADQHRTRGDRFAEATDLHSIAILTSNLVSQGAATAEEEREAVRAALDAAVRTGNRSAEAAVHQLVADDEDLDLETRIREERLALAIAEEIGEEGKALYSLRQLARMTVLRDRGEAGRAYALADEAVRRGRTMGQPATLARGLVRRAQIRWFLGPREAVIEEAFEAFDAIERIRDLQRDDVVRARLASEWSFYYYLFAGTLLAGTQGNVPSPDDVELAFSVMERLRGRVLLDALDAAGATSATVGTGPLHAERDRLLQEIGREQQRLQAAPRDAAGRRDTLERLARLEAQEASLRGAVERADPTFAALRHPKLPTLEELQGELRADEALLAFQLEDQKPSPTRTTGGSFVVVVTRDRVDVHPLPPGSEIAERISLYLGLLDRRDGSEREGSTALHRDLLARPLRDVPPGIKRLVIVPDGALFRLPFDALQAAPEAPPVAAAYEVSIAPSAALWLRWRRGPTHAAAIPALVLGDPTVPGAEIEHAGAASERGPGEQLGPLPEARREARAILRALGGGSRAVVGKEASEAFLASTDLRRFGVLHFAAHAVIDDLHPDRSALLLAPGGADQDGLLHVREIVDLDLAGSVVVLSACRSSAGPLLDGEGPMSLARGFFQAGARVVVGSLWPVRDDEAASLVSAFYRHLGRGVTVGEALARARRDALATGLPAAAWAGWVVMGDGSAAPVSSSRRSVGRAIWPLVALAGFALAGLVAWRIRRRAA